MMTPLVNENEQPFARIMTILLLVSCATFLIVFFFGLYYHDRNMLFVTVAGAVLQLLPFQLLRQRRLVGSCWTFSLIMLFILTLLATFGQGYRDLAIMAFPVILIFTSMTLSRSILIINSFLVLASIVWLVFGQMNGWFVPVPISGTYLSDFLLLVIILMALTFAGDFFATNMRKNLERARKEIAQRKQAETNLLESDSRFDQLAEQSRTIIWEVDARGLYTYVSRVSEQVWGYAPGEIIGQKHFYDLHPESGREAFKAAAFAVFETKEKFEDLLNPVQSKNGETVWVCTNGIPLLNPDGSLKGYRGSDRDVTESRLAEQTLRTSEEKYRNLFRHAAIGIFHSTFEGKFLDVNPALAKLLGYGSPEEVVGSITSIAGQVYADPPNYDAVASAALEAGGTVVSENRYRRRDGTLWHGMLHLRIVPGRQGSPGFYEGFVEDITERKQAETQLKQSEEKYRAFFWAIPIPTYTWRKDGDDLVLFDFNNVAVAFTQGVIKNIVGIRLSQMHKDNPQIQGDIRRCLEEKTVIERDMKYPFQSGRNVRDIHVKYAYVPPDFVMVHTEDFTEKVQAEEAMRNVQKLDSLGVLAGGIAHDFNNLLGGIYGYIDMAGMEATDERLSRYLSKAMNTIERARGLTMQLLTFAKGGAPIRKTGRLFPFVSETAQFALSGSNASCAFSIPENLWQADFDRNQMGQVIDNIVINAKQAMPDGGTIVISAANSSIGEKQHPALSAGDYVKISIQDCGIGIPKAILPRIFDPFYTTKDTGHGLGLATSYSIIKRHGGCIDVESEPGKGSTFHVFLPAVKGADSAAVNAASADHTGSGVFLVMDDQEVMRDTIGDMLKSFGYAVVCKGNGKDTIEFVSVEIKSKRTIAGMLFDLTIPGGIGGKETIGKIRKLDGCAKIPAFVMSGYADDPVMANPGEYGFAASICKPFRIAELSDVLNKYLVQKK